VRGKPHADLTERLVRLWNELRERKTPKPRKEVLVLEVLKLITGRVMDVVMRHDASRVVQACLKHGNAAQRESVCKELSGKALELTKAKHGHQLIEKMLHYGSPAVRLQLHKELKGHMARLMTHNIGALVIETGFSKAWSPELCWELYQELYGSEWVHFKASAAKGRGLGAVLEAYPDKRKSIFEAMFYTLSKQADKSMLGLSVAHKLLAEYLQYAPPEQVVGMVNQVKDHVLALVTTREGARAAALCFAYGTPKDRKGLWKAWKGRILDIACHDHGHLALIGALDVTDDTRTSGDAVWEELRPHLAYLALHRYGRKVLLHLLAPRSPRYFSVFDVSMLAPVTLPAYLANRKAPAAPPAAPAAAAAPADGAAADGEGAAAKAAPAAPAAAMPTPPSAEVQKDAAAMAPTATSKKPDAQRRAELLAQIKADLETALLQYTSLLARSEYGSGVLFEAATHLGSTPVFEAVADLLVEEPTAEEAAEQLQALTTAAASVEHAVPAELAGEAGAAAAPEKEASDAAAAKGSKAKRARTGPAPGEEGEEAEGAAKAGAGAAAMEEDGDDEEEEEEEAGEDDEEETEDEEEEHGSDSEAEGAAGAGAAADAEPEVARLPVWEHPPSHLLLKWLLQRESTRQQPGAPAAPADLVPVFGPLAASRLAGRLVSDLCPSNRGAFLCVELLQNKDVATAKAVRTELAAGTAGLKALPSSAGVKLLLAKLQEPVAAAAAPAGAAAGKKTPGKPKPAAAAAAGAGAATPVAAAAPAGTSAVASAKGPAKSAAKGAKTPVAPAAAAPAAAVDAAPAAAGAGSAAAAGSKTPAAAGKGGRKPATEGKPPASAAKSAKK